MLARLDGYFMIRDYRSSPPSRCPPSLLVLIVHSPLLVLSKHSRRKFAIFRGFQRSVSHHQTRFSLIPSTSCSSPPLPPQRTSEPLPTQTECPLPRAPPPVPPAARALSPFQKRFRLLLLRPDLVLKNPVPGIPLLEPSHFDLQLLVLHANSVIAVQQQRHRRPALLVRQPRMGGPLTGVVGLP